ncbi:longitudinals lacking protein, isoforms F/I/K/T-like isoform X8 [Cataglyphis hispanica]|uniref:longitudinals lacking protein, isoforms F/I/K/T-like isoform X8 n=1 Tax=Cataglyphis hispanica TaxID=1086592 RepID=UPI00217F3034|nr:longitudinals lacking protein, isoforms F/I/K/T-like isoform X8 [Cataglyphis hispanica]
MEDDQQFCLRWNNHQSTLIQNFDTLLESGTLVDCTLAAEGKTLKAHKVVLSACSPYFECLLSEHYDKHPVFILKDVKFKELKAMMDYMYRGEVNISQDQLAALLKAAESLQIKGLSESKTAGSSKAESRPQKTVSQPIARVSPSLDIPHASSGLTIEKNKVPRQSMAQGPVGDIPEDTASPQGPKRLCSREGSQSPTTRKRKRFRRGSLGEDNTLEMQDASNSSDMPQQMGVPALGITPVADEKVHADSTDSLGRSALMTQLTKPADEMLQLPLEKPEPNDSLIEPKSEYLEESEECVEDLTLDDDMNDLNDMEQDNNRAGPSHDPTQHPAGLGAWHVTGDRSNAGGVVDMLRGGAATGATDEIFVTPQEATAQQQRDSQGIAQYQEKQSLPDYPNTMLEQHLVLHATTSSQSYDGFGDTNVQLACESGNTYGPDWYPDNAMKQQRDDGQRRYQCPKCGNRYKYLGDMKKHVRFQCGQEPKFQCPYCRKRAKVSSNMYAHVRSIHGDLPIYIIDLNKQSATHQ